MKKKALVIHSGGMDSSICLALAIKEYGSKHVLSVSFQYGQRHAGEILQAAYICKLWGVDHTILTIDCLDKITTNALTNHAMPIIHPENAPPNTLVIGRNGLMARIGAIHAHSMGAHKVYMGVIAVDGSYSGYRDCSRSYFDLIERTLQIDLDDSNFKIETPLVGMTKAETMRLADQLGVLDFLLENTISCYEGIAKEGCTKCPACKLRRQGIEEYRKNRQKVEKPNKNSG